MPTLFRMERGIVIAVASRAGKLALEIADGRCAVLQLFKGAKVFAGDVLSGRLFNVGGTRLQLDDGRIVVCAMLGFRSRERALRMLQIP
jgi:acetamidase/formamidase